MSTKSNNSDQINGYDPNYFLENQLHNLNNTWDLFGPRLTKEGTFGSEVDHDKPILSGIIQDNSLTISGSHDYSGVNSGNVSSTIGNLVNRAKEAYNSLSDTVATDIGFLNDMSNTDLRSKLNNIISGIQEGLSESLGGSSVAGQLINAIGNTAQKGVNAVGSQMVTAFDYVKVFKGTSLSFNIPSLETRLIHGVHHARHLSDSRFKSERYEDVREKLLHLNNYFIGVMEGIAGLKDEGRSIDDIIGFQHPPSGYLPKFSLVKQYEELPNTFTLRYGNFMVPNLLIGSFNYNISNIRVRQGKSSRGDQNYDSNSTFHDMYTKVVKSPLYADVSISLIPCTFISRELINSIITGNYSVGGAIAEDLVDWGLKVVDKAIDKLKGGIINVGGETSTNERTDYVTRVPENEDAVSEVISTILPPWQQ